MKEYDETKLNSLKQEIYEKNEQLLDEINRALIIDDCKLALHLKQMQLQCAAQLRLIKMIESGFSDNTYIIC